MEINASLAGIAAVSLLGSAHCAGMCGAFALFASTTSKAGALLYNGGRLVSYVSAGALAGALGASFESAASGLGLAGLAGYSMGALMIGLGVSQIVSGSRHGRLGRLFGKKMVRACGAVKRSGRGGAFALGLLTGLMPCGWLYTFLALAAASAEASSGAAIMLAFWAGTVPALLGVSLLRLLPIQKLGPALPRIGGALLVTAGLASIWIRLAPGPDHCAHHTHGPEAFERAVSGGPRELPHYAAWYF